PGYLDRRPVQDPTGALCGGACRPSRLQRHHRKRPHGGMGRAGHTIRDRRRLFAAAQSSTEGVVSAEYAADDAGAVVEPGGGTGGLLVLRFTLAVTYLAALAIVAGAARGDALARNGTIRGRVELRRVVPINERRPNVAELGAAVEKDASEQARA